MLVSNEFPTKETVSLGKHTKTFLFLSLVINLSSWSCWCLVGHAGELFSENLCAGGVCIRVRKLETYQEYKEAASAYQEAWSTLRKQAFGSWIRNPPDYHQFKWEGKICKELTGSKVFSSLACQTSFFLYARQALAFLVAESEQNVLHLPDLHISFV